MRFIWVLALAALVSGCATYSGQSNRTRPLPEGSLVVVQREVIVPEGATSVWFQDGRYRRHLFAYWAPYCRLRVFGDTSRARRVAPETFRVIGTRREWIVGQRGMPLLAGLGSPHHTMTAQSGEADASPLYVTPEIVVRLRSDEQPEVQSLSCGQRQAPGPAQYLSLATLQAALGDYFRLEPAR